MTEIIPVEKLVFNPSADTVDPATIESERNNPDIVEIIESDNTDSKEKMAKFHFCRCQAEWFVRDGLGMTCSGMTYCLILFAEFVVIAVILLPGFPLSAWSYVHAILFSFLAFLAASSHLRAMTTNPVGVSLLIMFIVIIIDYTLWLPCSIPTL